MANIGGSRSVSPAFLALALTPVLPLPAVYLLFAVLGGVSGCWPDAILAEVDRLAPQDQVSLAISGSLVITNVGKFLGPIVLANVYAFTRNYSLAFARWPFPLPWPSTA